MDNRDSIITLQLGHYANFVGSHFWNTQEASFVYPDSHNGTNVSPEDLEINHGVLFREGVTNRGEVTFTPRLVSVDLKNALGSLPIHGDLYDKPPTTSHDQLESVREKNVHWGGTVDMTVEESEGKNDFLNSLDQEEEVQKQKSGNTNGSAGDHEMLTTDKETFHLESQVKVWSDFLRTRYHPRTNVVVQDYQHGDFAINPFDTYGLGYNASADLLEEIEDRVRYFAEECDSLKGFHLLTDSHTGFGGLSVRIAEILSEDYGSAKTVIAFPLTPSMPDMTEQMKAATGLVPAAFCTSMFLNSALTCHGLATGPCGLTSPLSLLKDTFPIMKTGNDHVRSLGLSSEFQPQLAYHSSSILASALDTLTLPWRSYNGSAPISSLITELNRGGRAMAGVAAAIPVLPWSGDTSLIDLLTSLEAEGKSLNSLATSLTPGSHQVSSGIDIQTLSIRGINRSMVCPSQTVTGKYAKIDHLGVALFKHYEGRVPTRSVFSIQSALPLKCPYPDIFQHPPNCGKSPPSISSMAMWQSSREGIGNTVKSLATRASKINLNKFPKFLNSGYEADTHVQTVEELTELSECY